MFDDFVNYSKLSLNGIFEMEKMTLVVIFPCKYFTKMLQNVSKHFKNIAEC
jgi:hypothetical protein